MKIFFFLLLSFVFTSSSAVSPPTMGWSSWNTYRINISDSLICAQADAMKAKGLGKVGYRYVNIDDGFFGGRRPDGRLLIHPRRFPNGLKPVVDHIHSLGFKAGIYSDAGRNTCGNYWDNDTIARGVGLYGHDHGDAAFFFRELGFDFIKIDFCGGDAKQNSEKLDLDERERYAAIRKAIDAVGRKDVRVNVCRWAFPGTWVSSIGSSWRISGDIGPNWSSVKRIIRENRYLSAYAVGGSFNDMDMLEVGRGLTEAEERTHFGMWCIQSSPLLIGCDLTRMPEATLQLVKNPELIALNQDVLGKQAYVVNQTSNGLTLYVKDLKKENGNLRAVAVYNPGEHPVTFTLHFSDVDLGGKVEVRDLYARKNLPATRDSIRFEVQPHDTRIFSLRAAKRLQRACYEAETAWLNRYQELGYNPGLGYAQYTDDSECSGGAKVTHLGKHTDNWLEWRNLSVAKTGRYRMVLRYSASTDACVRLIVDGVEISPLACKAGKENLTFEMNLKRGNHTLRLSPEGEAPVPDIDCLTVSREPLVEKPRGKGTAEGKFDFVTI